MVGRGGVDGAAEHVGLHHHARAAARRRVVDGAMLVGGERPDIDDVERPRARRQRLAGEARAQGSGKNVREDGQYARPPHLLTLAAKFDDNPSRGDIDHRHMGLVERNQFRFAAALRLHLDQVAGAKIMNGDDGAETADRLDRAPRGR